MNRISWFFSRSNRIFVMRQILPLKQSQFGNDNNNNGDEKKCHVVMNVCVCVFRNWYFYRLVLYIKNVSIFINIHISSFPIFFGNNNNRSISINFCRCFLHQFCSMKFIATTIIINIISCTHLHLAINWWKYYFLRIKYDFSPSLNRNHKKSRLKLVDTHTHRPLIYEIFFVNFHFDNLSIFIIKDFVINFFSLSLFGSFVHLSMFMVFEFQVSGYQHH